MTILIKVLEFLTAIVNSPIAMVALGTVMSVLVAVAGTIKKDFNQKKYWEMSDTVEGIATDVMLVVEKLGQANKWDSAVKADEALKRFKDAYHSAYSKTPDAETIAKYKGIIAKLIATSKGLIK